MTDQSQVNKKKTRIKLVGKGWSKGLWSRNTGDIVEVEKCGDVFKLDGFPLYTGDGFEIEILPDEPAQTPESEKPFEFRVGDTIRSLLGDRHILTSCAESDPDFPLRYYENNTNEIHVSLDGTSAKVFANLVGIKIKAFEGSLISLVERPKKTVKKTYWVATYLENDFIKVPAKIYTDKESGEIDLRFIRDVQFHEITREEIL